MLYKTAPNEPRWRTPAQFNITELPADIRRCLLDDGSLTDWLMAKSGGNFRVQRLSQRWQRPLLSERRLLQQPHRHSSLIREVALYCNEQPWVYARSILPAATLSGPLRHLRRLQNQSLGSLLFNNPNLGRGDFELALLAPHSTYIHPQYRQTQPAWARRSVFILRGKPLIVSEVFLHSFCA